MYSSLVLKVPSGFRQSSSADGTTGGGAIDGVFGEGTAGFGGILAFSVFFAGGGDSTSFLALFTGGLEATAVFRDAFAGGPLVSAAAFR